MRYLKSYERVILVLWAVWLVWGIVIFAQQQRPNVRIEPEMRMRTNYELQLPAEGYIPNTVVIKKSLSEKALVCAEPIADGMISCRTVGEFRNWVIQRQEMK